MQDREAHGKPIEALVSGLARTSNWPAAKGGAGPSRKIRCERTDGAPRRISVPALGSVQQLLVIILIIAALVSLALGEYVDSIAIMFIVVLNAWSG